MRPSTAKHERGASDMHMESRKLVYGKDTSDYEGHHSISNAMAVFPNVDAYQETLGHLKRNLNIIDDSEKLALNDRKRLPSSDNRRDRSRQYIDDDLNYSRSPRDKSNYSYLHYTRNIHNLDPNFEIDDYSELLKNEPGFVSNDYRNTRYPRNTPKQTLYSDLYGTQEFMNVGEFNDLKQVAWCAVAVDHEGIVIKRSECTGHFEIGE